MEGRTVGESSGIGPGTFQALRDVRWLWAMASMGVALEQVQESCEFSTAIH